MDKKTLVALKGSIEKWSKIVRSTRALDKRGKNCPLCILFGAVDCEGCPIASKVLTDDCFGTPYREWLNHQRQDHPTTKLVAHRHSECIVCLDIAKAELNFLKSLLPK